MMFIDVIWLQKFEEMLLEFDDEGYGLEAYFCIKIAQNPCCLIFDYVNNLCELCFSLFTFLHLPSH